MHPNDESATHDNEAQELARAAEALREGTATPEQVELLGGKGR